MNITPRFIRLRDAAAYLGMDKNRFNSEVRPHLTEIPIGSQGIAFDRIDLDDWADEYIRCNGRPAEEKGGKKKPWRKERQGVSSRGKASGISTRSSEEEEFARAVERATSRKPSDT